MAAISAPVSTPLAGMPSSAMTWRATCSLSPVTTFTATPLAASACSAGRALALGGSKKAAKPASTSSLSSSTTASTRVSGARLQAMASTRKPSRPRLSNRACTWARVASSNDFSSQAAPDVREQLSVS